MDADHRSVFTRNRSGTRGAGQLSRHAKRVRRADPDTLRVFRILVLFRSRVILFGLAAIFDLGKLQYGKNLFKSNS